MNKKSGTSKAAATKLVKSIRRKTRQAYSAEEKIRIVLAGLRGEESISALCVVKAFLRACITVGQRNFSKPGNAVCQAIQPVKQHRRR